MADDNYQAKIHRNERKLSVAGDIIDIKELTVASDDLTECKKVFDEEWSKK
jgi:hypothetical protein